VKRAAIAIGVVAALGAASLGCGLVESDGASSHADAGADRSSASDGRGDAGSISNGNTDSSVVVGSDAGVAAQIDRSLCANDLDCVRSDAVGTCVSLVGGGFRVCSFPPPVAQPCSDAGTPGGPFSDECCGTNTSACSNGVCTVQASCGGAFINPHNVCVSDECSKNSDCGARGVCLPTGVGDVHRRTCLPSNDCVADAECGPGGACVLLGAVGPAETCMPFSCGQAPAQVATKMACVFAGDCRDDRDCPSQHCEATNVGPETRTRCAAGERVECPPPP
jgi:hypothetical protein